MSIESAVQDEIMISSAEATAYGKVQKMLEKEAAKMRDCGDGETADYVEMLLAKVKALEAGRLP